MNKKLISLILGIMCFFLTVGIFVQVKTVKNSQAGTAKTTTEAELRDNILRFQEKYDESFSKLNDSNERLESLIQNLSQDGENDSEELKNLNSLLGYTDLEGQGLIITVEDGNSSTVKGLVSNYLVHDGDLIKIVNLLKYAGAEAISINDERIITNTAITCAGNIVSINGKKVGSPFVIKSIGLTEKLYGTVTVTDSYLSQMEEEGVKVTIEKKDKVDIIKYNGIYSFNYAK